MTPLQKFNLWFTEPAKRIEKDGDAAFIVFIAAFSALERFIKSRMKAEKDLLGIRRMSKEQKKEFFFILAAKTLGVEDLQLFKDFWHMYRDGLAHYFHPMIFERDGKQYGYEISGDFEELPVYHSYSDTTFSIRISPWKFAQRVAAIWQSREDILNSLPQFPLGDIYQVSP